MVDRSHVELNCVGVVLMQSVLRLYSSRSVSMKACWDRWIDTCFVDNGCASMVSPRKCVA